MRLITLSWFLVWLLLSSLVNAQIYKTVDEHGNVVFTDKPSRSQPSEPVHLKPVTTLPPPPLSSPHSGSAFYEHNTSARQTYTDFSIISPINDSTIRNNGHFTIRLSVQPTLANTHQVRFLIDGVVVAGPQKALSHSVENMHRGTHHIQVDLVDSANTIIKSSQSTVHVQRTIYKPATP